MRETKFPPVEPEPAHPMVVNLHDDLLAIYTLIRDKYQAGIDQAFDRVSREIGFVVATALPFTFEVKDERAMGVVVTDGLQGTLWDRELARALKGIEDDPVPIKAGTYSLYLFWFEALKLKLRTDWMEPAHFRRGRIVARPQPEWAVRVRPEVQEPAHWFDPGTPIAPEERVLISVIDEVYPELRLADRIGDYRRGIGRMPGEEAGPSAQPAEPPPEMLAELKDLLRRYRY